MFATATDKEVHVCTIHLKVESLVRGELLCNTPNRKYHAFWQSVKKGTGVIYMGFPCGEPLGRYELQSRDDSPAEMSCLVNMSCSHDSPAEQGSSHELVVGLQLNSSHLAACSLLGMYSCLPLLNHPPQPLLCHHKDGPRFKLAVLHDSSHGVRACVLA